MTAFLIRLLAAVGLVPAGHHQTLKLSADQVKAETQIWKDRAREATARADKLAEDLNRQTKLLERQQQQTTDSEKLRERLSLAERELIAAREQLMAVEVKLDILEGAANVLDLRTRAAISRQHTSTTASS